MHGQKATKKIIKRSDFYEGHNKHSIKNHGCGNDFFDIFVRAGSKTGVSGGQQTGTILSSFFRGLSDTINSLTGAN